MNIDNDQMTKLITERLGERQEMLRKIEKWEKKSSKKLPFTLVSTLAVAACLAVMFILNPFTSSSPLDEVGIEQPTILMVRGNSEDIAEVERLMNKPDYQTAVIKVQNILCHIKMLKEMVWDLPEDFDKEEAEYEISQYDMMESDVRWTYIYILVKVNDFDIAKKELKKYIKHPEYAQHLDEAKELLEVLKKK